MVANELVGARLVHKQGTVEEIRYEREKDGLHYKHPFTTTGDMWLVTVGRKKAVLIIAPDDTPLWGLEA